MHNHKIIFEIYLQQDFRCFVISYSADNLSSILQHGILNRTPFSQYTLKDAATSCEKKGGVS